MVCRVQDIVVYTVPAIPIVLFLSGLTAAVMALIRFCVGRLVDLVVVAAPESHLQFAMRVHDRSVEELNLTGGARFASTTFPEITMNQTWFHDMAVPDEFVQEAGYHLARSRPCSCVSAGQSSFTVSSMTMTCWRRLPKKIVPLLSHATPCGRRPWHVVT